MDAQSDQLITGLFCPTCGYDMTGHERSVRVTCPECGGEHALEQLYVGPPPSRLEREVRSATRVVQFVLIIAAIAGIGVLVSPMSVSNSARSGPHRPLSSKVKMKLIHQSALAFGREFGGMPNHVALLIADNYVGPEWFLDPTLNTNSLLIGEIDLLNFTWSDESIEVMKVAVEEMDVANSIYTVGDFNFVGWETAPLDPRLVFSWSKPRSDGDRLVGFMDNSVRSVPQSEWQGMWDQDAAAREELGLPALKRK